MSIQNSFSYTFLIHCVEYVVVGHERNTQKYHNWNKQRKGQKQYKVHHKRNMTDGTTGLRE